MLKFFFWSLLLANIALFAYQRGYLEPVFPSGREPARMGNQLNADKIRLVPPPDPKAAPAPDAAPAVVAAESKPASKPEMTACIEVGNFNAADAKRFSEQLAALSLGEHVMQRKVQEVSSHMVYIPSQGDKEGADKKAGELRRLGITDFFIIQDNSSLRWGISLGVFKKEEAAQAHLADLQQKGVKTARIGQRGVTSNLIAFQIREPDAEAVSALEKIKQDFPRQEMRSGQRCSTNG